MAKEKYRFFDSVGDDRIYQADEFAEYFRLFLTSGIKNGGTCLKVTAPETGMQLEVDYGVAMLEGYAYWLEDDGNGKLVLQMPAADPQPRIDRVVLRLDRALSERKIGIYVKRGVPAELPTPPDLEREANIFECALAKVRIPANLLKILPEHVTDERLNPDACGLIHSLIELDTSDFYAEAAKAIDDIKHQGYLPLTGGTMQGDLGMGGHALTGLAQPGQDTAATPKSYVDSRGYSKSESDGRYETKGTAYSKGESDGKYEIKNTAYTRAESDGKYETKNTAYAKSESDSRYATVAQGAKADAALPKTDGCVPDNAKPLPAGANLNDYKTPGFFYANTNDLAKTIVNSPTVSGFALIILRGLGYVQVLLRYDEPSSPIVRAFYNGAWSTWTYTASVLWGTSAPSALSLGQIFVKY